MKIFYENIRFSKTHSEYQEQPYLLEKTTIALLDPPKKMHVTFVGYLWNIGEYSYIQYSRNIIWGYSPEFYRELFPNIPGIYHGNVPRIFHENIFARYVDF